MICLVIIISILFGNYFTQNYTQNVINKLSNELIGLREEIIKDDNNEIAKEKISDIYKTWKDSYDKLAYFIEHDELEKVENDLTSLNSYIETNENAEAVNELDKSEFILKHIEDKYAFNLQNIF